MTDDYAETLARYGMTGEELSAFVHMIKTHRRGRFADVPLPAVIGVMVEHLATEVETGGFADSFGDVDRGELSRQLRSLLVLIDTAEFEEVTGSRSRNGGESVTASRNCEFCGQPFAGRADAQYCSNAHRQAAYRARP